MLIFAAGAQEQILSLTGAKGAMASGNFLGMLLHPKAAWSALTSGVSTIGLVVMDVGSLVISAGWKLTVYGFFAWASMGLLKNAGRLLGIIGNEVLRSIPVATATAA